MIQITKSRVVLRGSAREQRALADEFAAKHFVRLPRIIAPDLLRQILDKIDYAAFAPRTYTDMAANRELCLSDGAAVALFRFLLNDERLLRFVREVTGSSEIDLFDGRIYRMLPRHGHHDAWHSDANGVRIAALSINLGVERYRGGILRIRDRSSRRLIGEAENVELGDAILFRIAPYLEHRITDVEGSIAKMALAGWFQIDPNFQSLASLLIRAPGRLRS